MKKLCVTCGTIDKTKRFVPGSFLIEILLWLCFFIPGLIYSIWRLSSAKQVCRHCESKDVIPLDSPRAKNLLSEKAARHG